MKTEIKLVQTQEEYKDEKKRISQSIQHRSIKAGKRTLIVTPTLFGKLFSPKRIELLCALSQNKYKSVTKLAESLQRPFEVVFRDLKLFERFELVKIKKEQQRSIPVLNGKIQLPVIA